MEELRKLEQAFSHQQEILSFVGWLISAQYRYIDESGFIPVDRAMYEKLCDSLARALEDANKSSYAFSAFTNLLKKSHFLQFSAPTVTLGQKTRLTASDPFADQLFDPEILSAVSKEYDNEVATASHISVSKAISRGLFQSNKRKREDSPVPSTSKTPQTPASTTSAPKSGSSSLFDPPPKGTEELEGWSW